MAVVNAVQLNTDDDGVIRLKWTLANGDTGAPVASAQWADRSIQVEGTFGAGGNLRWEGSNDGALFEVLSDPQGTALNVTSAKIKAITEVVAFARPNVTAGDGTTSIVVTLTARRPQPLRA